ncbi:MAG: cytidylate kinase family protein [candidate division Zixibacteria bacterium]|nr:cytidylate kinase family protein [candidate division Zixibacteria bacterium]
MASIDAIINRQLLRWELEKKQVAEQPSAKPAPPQVVTVSRQAGSRGSYFATRLAEELSFNRLHRETIDAICDSSGYRRRIVENLDERFRSDLDVMVQGMITGQSVDHRDYARHLFQVVLSMARLGGVVLVGRGGNFILGPRRGFHIRVVAPREQRIANLVKYKNVTKEVAATEADRVNSERKELMTKLFGHDIDDPAHYDLIINLGLMDLEEMVRPTIAAIHAKFARLATLAKE